MGRSAVATTCSHAPDGLDPVDVQAARTRCAGRDDRVIQHGFDDRLLATQIQITPPGAQHAAGAGQLEHRRGVGGGGDIAAGHGNALGD